MITVFESELVAVRRLSLGRIEINEVLAERLKRIATAKNVKLYFSLPRKFFVNKSTPAPR